MAPADKTEGITSQRNVTLTPLTIQINRTNKLRITQSRGVADYSVALEPFVREGFHDKLIDKNHLDNFLSLNSATVFFLLRAIATYFWHIILLQRHFPLNAATVNFCLRLATTLFSVTESCHRNYFVRATCNSKCVSLNAAKEVVSSRGSCHAKFLPMMMARLFISSWVTTNLVRHYHCSLT